MNETKHMYTCPMHPEVRQDKPGRCSKCSMFLVQEGDSSHGYGDHGEHRSEQASKNESEHDCCANHVEKAMKDNGHDYHHGAKSPVAAPSGSGIFYTCPMDPDVISDRPGECPKCGMDLVPMDMGGANDSHEGHTGHGRGAEQDFKLRFLITLPLVLLVTALSPNIEKWFHFNLAFPGMGFVTFLLGAFVFAYGGWPFFKAAKGELSHKLPAMMTLVAFGITVAFGFSVATTFLFPGESLYWEMSTLISVFLLGHWLEMRAVRGATGALTELAKLIPPSAHLIGSGNVKEVQTSELAIGNRVLVKPGEKIPIDGRVIEGESSVNESMITGESRPISKKAGDAVIGGSLNQDGSLTIEVSKTGADTAISQIMKLVREAQGSKPNVQHLADRAAAVLFYVAMVAGIASFSFWYFASPQGAIFAATVAVAAIVVACPHALGLAIPTVTSITSTLGARNGILIKDMKGLEAARKLDYVIFDKTGTLTKGEFGVADVILAKDSNISRNEMLKLAAAVEVSSQHSIGKGIVDDAKRKNIAIPSAKGFKSYPGRGASAEVDGKNVIVGNRKLMEELNVSIDESPAAGSKIGTPVYVAVNSSFAGVILLEDIIRDESKATIQKLHDMGIKTAMLTGDTADIAEAVGKELGIDTVFAHVLPEDKVNKVKELQNGGNIVAMVGDGVNDAAALTQSHVGIAIGAGTDVAVASASIVLMKSNPLDVAKAIALSLKTNSKMVQNLAWATGYNVFAIPVAAGVLYPSLGILLRPEWAALLMSASSVIVVLNALLLRREKLS
ncbi:MAG: cadmium-translocating P-type ATPase [Patescibacteria group bacterium]|nr:cadmium-translocating P-type ATPase [Patescibacteria group bacterium]